MILYRTPPRLSRSIAEHPERKIPERLLGKFWKERAARLTGLRTEAGQRVRVVYPGRSGVTAGPDFRDALLEVEGLGLVRGNVELHLDQRDWDSHGHGGDPNYNGVVVHGALEVFSTETRLHSGSTAVVVDLGSLLTEASEEGSALDLWEVLSRKGFHRPETSDQAKETLDRAGDQRFLAKSRWFSTCIREDGPDQALYAGLMEGLGYSSNRRPFAELACLAPYRALAEAALELPQDQRVAAICGWLQDCSGLQGGDTSGWNAPRGSGPAMDPREWKLFRVRPANHPRRRIMGAALLLERSLGPGLAAGLREVVEQLSPARLVGALSAHSRSGPAYVGRGRAKDLAVNAVLPFMQAWQESGAAEAAYRDFPLLAENEITREMTDQLLPVGWHKAVNNARRQQGLLHLSALLTGAG